MPAAASNRSGAASPGPRTLGVRRPAANPWKLDLRELGRRAGSMQQVERTLPAPDGWRVELIGVPAGGDVHLDLRLESVMEGVLVTGDLDVPVTGSCARCLEPIEDTLHLDVQELYAYEGSTTEATSEEDEVRRIEGDFLDLEPLVRDSVVLNLPLAPVCTEDCAGPLRRLRPAPRRPPGRPPPRDRGRPLGRARREVRHPHHFLAGRPRRDPHH